ncbi:unhealthy ribosome biogenesis protein 2 homolog [Eublepharis macularius]|uniref:Unhealthy ribosome biogenesis protein 2 homolog n=1 Tax=Eublepharis macularius TaxID=481883 RepID=A0AA97LFH5_EUBMA|nr:unhealthy ribosome biogenesis protein 2 homolog [Eublepharis macularius]XP_054853844.1 unhealthy ribosome biogenesis protein 2 homolog [Eublepharis macularius]XP_054853853.1 unhealthy ribosome biogenesis protein 2 homolog [Eublepharis macularius]
MAAIYSGIHLKLKNSKTSWEDKLKLAQFAWISHQCFLPNKEQVLLDWVSHTLVSCYNKKLELSDEITGKLWTFLDNVLHSKKLQSLLKEGRTVTLRFSIAQVINERLSISYTQKTLKDVNTVLNCCKAILSIPPLTIVYTAKSELLVDLLSKLSWLVCWQLSSEDAVSSQLFEVLQLTLGQYLLIQRQQANANRVFGQVTKLLLQPCLLLRHLLTARVWTQSDDGHGRQHLNREIRNGIETLVRAGIFQPELLPSYREELLPEKESHNIKKGALKSCLLPAHTIQMMVGDTNFCHPALHGKTVTNSVPLLFKLFLESYNKAENHLVCFHMLTKLFGCLKIARMQGDLWNDQLSPSEWSSELLAVEQLLNSVLSSSIYNVAVDKIRHKEVQFHFYRQVAQTLVNHPQATIPAWFRCFKALISLNHLIVEPDLDDLVASAWIDAEVSEPRTKKAQEALINALFQTYAKLRQFQRLLEEVLSVICRPAAEVLRLPVLPAGIRSKLCEYLLELPPNQILDILYLILEKCQTSIIPDVRGDSDMALKLQSMSSLLHSVLFNMRSLNDSTPLPVVHRAQNLLETMQKDIIQTLLDLLKDCQAEDRELEFWVEKVGYSLLLLACTWVATDTLFGLNCSKYTSPLGKVALTIADPTINFSDFSAVLPGFNAKCWEKITKLLSCSCSGSRYCIEWLVLQKMKRMLMYSSCQTEALFQTMQHAAAFILHSGRSCMIEVKPELWDGNAGVISNFTYPTAHWHLVISNLPVLIPFLSAKDTHYIADLLLKTLLVNQTHAASTDADDILISIEKVSKDFLHSPFLPEMRMLHSSFLNHIVQHCTDVLYSAVQSVANRPLQQLSTEGIPRCEAGFSSRVAQEGHKDELSMCWTAMEKVAQNILSLVKVSSFITLEEEQIERILDLLEIISVLNLDSLFPMDHARIFLLLLSLAINTRTNVACSEALSLKLLATCFHLLACLQAGRNVTSSFKVLHASDALEAVLTAMFEVCKTFASALTAVPWEEFLHRVQGFLEHYLQAILERWLSVKLNMEKFLSFLTTCQPCKASSEHSEHCNPAADQLLLVALTAQCHVLTLHIQKQSGNLQASEKMLLGLLKQAVLQTGTTIQLFLRNSTKGQPLPSVFVLCVTTLLKADSSCAHSAYLVTGEDEQKRPKVPNRYQQLSHSDFYQRFYAQILRELNLAGGSVQLLSSVLHFLAVFCSVPELLPAQEDASVAVFHSIRKLLAGPGITLQMIQSVEMQLTELTAQLVKNCTDDNFCAMLRLVFEGLDICNVWKQNTDQVLSAVILVKLLLGCPLSGEKEKAFWFSSPQLITALAMQAKEASQDHIMTPTLLVLILETAAVLLRKGERILSNPHHVALVFSILLTIPLDHLKAEDYYSIFLGIHEVLFSILQCHPKVMLKAAPSFLCSFHKLVISVMHEGRQKGDGGISDELEVILKCAQMVERMYSYIAVKTEEFTVFSAFIVGQYVTELQKVTLHPAVKKHLTEGIYQILDLCIESDIKFLNASLPMGVRDVLRELYRNYTHYHKTLKRGDERYTA